MISTTNNELSVARSVSVHIMAVTIYAANQLLQTAVEPRFHTSSDCNTPLLTVWRGFCAHLQKLLLLHSVAVLIVAVTIHVATQILQPAVGPSCHPSLDCNTPC